MLLDDPDSRLSRISTVWSLVQCAHGGSDAVATAARRRPLEWCGVVGRGYVRRVLHDADAADEVFQELAVRLLHGDLRGADPNRGRFRDFVKGTLLHLVANHRKRQQRWPSPLPADGL